MNGQEKPDPKASVKELLLEEYRNFSESLWRNEQTGETRVNWFIGIVSGAAAGLIALGTAEHRPHGAPLRLILVGALVALIAFGIVTLIRIKKRNETTDGYKKDTDRIRELFKQHFDSGQILSDYHPFKKPGDTRTVRRFGGLVDIVITINSLLFAALAATLVYRFGSAPPAPLGPTYAAALFALWISFIGQRAWVTREQPRLTHAGGIVYRLVNDQPQYCLVGPKEPKEDKDEWLFPKGHIDNDEEPWETAVREVGEETGVVGRLICPVGSNAFELPHEKIGVKYFLIEALSRDAKRTDNRTLQWFEFDEAKRQLTHPDNQDLLAKAEAKRRVR